MKETLDQLAERERAMAKAFSMSVLFGADPYWNIVGILDSKEEMTVPEFKKALLEPLATAGLDQADQDWVINYLLKYDKNLAAASDAKWPINPNVGARKLHW